MRISDWSSDVYSSDLLAQQKGAVARVSGHVAVELRRAVEGRLAGELRQAGRRDEEVLAEALGRPQQVFRQHHPTEPPAGHREVLGEGIDDDRIVGQLQRADAGLVEADAMVDLRSEEHTSELQSLMRISY